MNTPEKRERKDRQKERKKEDEYKRRKKTYHPLVSIRHTS
jgi:hypothetical protein